MKKLVIFYSFEGNTKYIAENIAEAVGADMLELKPKKDVSSGGFMKYLLGGSQVVLGKKPELNDLDKNLEEYDVIFIGTPVWASNYAPSLRTFFSQVNLKNKKIALFCCNRGGVGKTFTAMREELKENHILGEIEFVDPIKGQQGKASMAKEWALEIVNK